MKNRFKNMEEGSAIILAILVLAFFMALSLNMYFLATKKSERAGVKAKGVKVLSNIDGGASIGYYELSRASNMVTNGVLRPTTLSAIINVISTTNPVAVYRGAVIEKYQQYFGGVIDTTNPVVGGFVDMSVTFSAIKFTPTRTSDAQSVMWFRKDITTSAAIYNEVGTTPITELWNITDVNAISVGGFKIDTTGGRQIYLNGTQVSDIDSSQSLNSATIRVKYIKRLNLRLNLRNNELKYSITCNREVKYTTLGAIDSDEITDIIVLFE